MPNRHLLLLGSYLLTLRSRPEQLKLFIGGARCIDKKFESHGKGVELCFDAQAFELERGVNGYEYVVALGSYRVRR